MANLVDHRGNPIKTGELRKEHGAPTVSGVRSVWQGSVNASLTPASLATILSAAANNDPNAYLTLAEEMEERDLHYRSVMQTRKLAVSSLNVSVDTKTDDAADVDLADEIREEIVEAPEFEDMLIDVLDGLGKGFSCTEIAWDRGATKWRPAGYDWRDPRFFNLDQYDGQTIRLITDENQYPGEDLAPYKWITHKPKMKSGLPIRGGIARLVAVAFMCKSYGIKDWLAFAEIFGMPIRVGVYGPQATEDDIRKLKTAVANIGIDAAAVMPDGMSIDFQEAARASGGDKLFENLARFLDEQVSKGVLGQTMTSDTGSSQAQANVHNDVRLDLLRSDARQLSNTINRDLIKPYIDLNYGPRERNRYPMVRIHHEEPEDLKLLAEALPPFIDRGLAVESTVIREKFGLPEPDTNSEILSAKGSGNAPAGDPGDEEKEAETDEDKKADALNAMIKHAVTCALNETGAGKDEIDRMLDDKEWMEITEPTFAPLITAINAAETYEELEEALDEVELDVDKFVRDIAIEMFKSRGLGDATDKI